MKPTPEQIEAAARTFSSSSWNTLSPEDQHRFREKAISALTAAAGVMPEYRVCDKCNLWVHKPTVYPPDTCIEAVDALSPPPFDAAAEVGPQTDLELVNRGLMGKIQLLQKERKQTIERCAQELEAAYAECNTLNLLHGAARLRALKDKP